MGDDSYKFQKLTPVSDVELGIYGDAIDFVFDNDDLKNVAISGQYSAGKSSLVESYKKSHPQLKFVHISLTHFRTTDQNEPNESEKSIKETALEGKILNQLIHQIDADDIPQTNFKVKKKVKYKRVSRDTFFTVLFIVMALHITLFDKWRDFVSLLSESWIKTLLTLSTSYNSLLISGTISTILACVFIYILIKTQKNRRILKKISLQGNEIDIFEENEDSYFDRYLNEVLYLFENINADAIVFEDMDRFNANHIFERLHEVNRLVNIQRNLTGSNKPVLRFIYLLRDDIFISKDRTKFFDYIVPVIPVVDSSNSYDQFISLFYNGGILKLFNEKFLQGLSLYIDDMRILKNIYNEFQIYYNRLNTTELNCNKMLAIITYKNIFPRDFSELQVNQGMVFTIFNGKEFIVNDEVKRLEQEIISKENDINIIKNEILNSIEEVNTLYDHEKAPYSNYSYYEDKIADIENRRESRKENVENKINNRIDAINDDILKLKNELTCIRNKKIKDIITRENIDGIFKITHTNEIGEVRDFNEIKSSEYFNLLKYLIRGGYIDETYTDYMTYFYENSLSRVDKMFLRSITDQRAKEFTYQLKNPKLVIARLKEVDFEQEEALNFDLLAYLLQSPVHNNLTRRLFKKISKDKYFEFIHDYFETQKAQANFINKLNTLWPEFFSYSLKVDKFSADWIKRYSIGTFYYSSIDNIKDINIDNCLTDYISGSSDYLSINDPKIDKLIIGFKHLNVSFTMINFEKANKSLFNEIYQNSLYNINFSNLALMLSKIYQINDESDIHHKNYTLVMSQPDSPLANYVNSHIGNYIDTILSNCNGSITDDENIALSILNNKNISDEQKNKYIDSLQTPITSLTDIENKSLWLPLLDKDLITCSETNILSYFISVKRLDNSLIGFINRSDVELNFTNIEIEEEQKQNIFTALISCDDLSNDKYEKLVCSIHLTYQDSFDIINIPDDKFKILVDRGIIHMDLGVLESIRENYPEQLLYYIKANINEYVEIMTDDVFSLYEITSILSSDVDDKIKIKLLAFVKTPITIENKKYPTLVNDYILKNNFEPDEILNLASSYKEWNTSTQLLILNQVVLYISELIASPHNASEVLLKDLFASEQLNEQRKIELLTSLLSSKALGKMVCKEYLVLIGLLEFSKIMGRGKPKIEVNAINQKLLTALKNSDLLSSFEEDEENQGYYLIRK